MSDPQICPHAGHISEFGQDPVEAGIFWRGTCTQTALEVCEAIVDKRDPTFVHMTAITREMVSKGLCATNGAATVAGVAQMARDHGYHTTIEWDYAGDQLPHDWHSVLLQNAGVNPILLQVANGQALSDVETGSRDESGLHYHAIAIVGKQTTGYVCADGDNPQVSSRFQIYTYATLAAASPCGLLMLAMPQPPPPPPAPPPPSLQADLDAANTKIQQLQATLASIAKIAQGG